MAFLPAPSKAPSEHLQPALPICLQSVDLNPKPSLGPRGSPGRPCKGAPTSPRQGFRSGVLVGVARSSARLETLREPSRQILGRKDCPWHADTGEQGRTPLGGMWSYCRVHCSLSMTLAAPIPVPMHMDVTPNRPCKQVTDEFGAIDAGTQRDRRHSLLSVHRTGQQRARGLGPLQLGEESGDLPSSRAALRRLPESPGIEQIRAPGGHWRVFVR